MVFADLPGRTDVLVGQFQILFTVPDGQLDRVQVGLLSDGEVAGPVAAADGRVAGEEMGGVLVERELVQWFQWAGGAGQVELAPAFTPYRKVEGVPAFLDRLRTV
ncbi:hypothetical protein ABZX72_20825 [Streptomyces cyaneofuscatus]|uniref:hypothetical protein n=1 Tax=Streptomyces cyaneofuscatus TaxID=66883 RepID=UPI0033A7B0BB